jgi:hypothetical protein
LTHIKRSNAANNIHDGSSQIRAVVRVNAMNPCRHAVFMLLNDLLKNVDTDFHLQGGWAMRASLMTLVGAATVLAASLTGASAQVLNLTGQFQCVRLCLATPPAFAYLTQADWELNLVNEAGVPSRAWIDYPGHISVAAWNEGAFYSPDGMTIQFDNGTVWQRVIEVAPVRRPFYRPLATND